MKYCPNCGASNQGDAMFCEQCGHHFISEDEGIDKVELEQELRSVGSDPVPVYKGDQKPTGRNKIIIIFAAVLALGIIVGTGIYFATSRKEKPEPVVQTTPTSTTSEKEEEAEEAEEANKYDAIIQEAKVLTINGNYKESSLKLASIPVSELSKEEFSSIREAVEELTKQNNDGIQEEKGKQSEEAKKQAAQSATASGFTGDFAKWANTFLFYYSQGGQKQSSLTISANGGVTQNNYDGTQYFGKATIASSGGSILSYETNESYPMDMPATKMIRPDVAITVQWDVGGSQVFYGYLSYSSRLALTDGLSKNAGVNEVWISY
ncbi:zinc-ribbon domain-containing protein [Vagococcus elongatus]|uniref:Zinc ribbon domain-containing protein n=1 Tax=Vagococcus elongatus TaxID=180344 RepID=A0A430B1Z1_9ENTE|nr:zinc-ribbon domain-containing protein [Vagococcus elongatus]RSU14357.1 zinc ribbon domain-containing protein [Vagococcus elongatus]